MTPSNGSPLKHPVVLAAAIGAAGVITAALIQRGSGGGPKIENQTIAMFFGQNVDASRIVKGLPLPFSEPRRQPEAGVAVRPLQEPIAVRPAKNPTLKPATATDEHKVEWYVLEPDCGSITPSGIYTAPSRPAGSEVERKCHIAAVSGGVASALATVTIKVGPTK